MLSFAKDWWTYDKGVARMNYTCRNCGGDLEPMGKGMGKCSYCKAINSMPNIVSEKIARAERLRREMLNFI